jgi:hypothetical protein
MKKLLYLFPILAVMSLTVSCEKEDVSENENQLITKQEVIPKEDLQKIASLHFNNDDVEMIDFLLPDGTTEKNYLIEGDILMKPEQLDKLYSGSITSKQYRTYNLVYSPRNVNIIGFTGGGGQGLTS